MKKSKAAAAAAIAVAAAAAIWAGGVLASSMCAERLLSEGCARVTSALGQKTEGGIMPFSIKVSYKKSEGGFLSEKGAFTIESSQGKSVVLDASTSHGFLSFDTDVDLIPILNNLFVKSGVLVMAKSQAAAEIKARILPASGSLSVDMGGQYSRGYLDAAKLQPQGQELSIKAAATALESDKPRLSGRAKGVIAPAFRADSLSLSAVSGGRDDPGSLSASVKGLDVRNLGALAVVDDASVKVESVKSGKDSDFDLKVALDLRGSAGSASLEGVLGPFSREKAMRSGAAVSDLITEPGALGAYFSKGEGYARIGSIKASADTDMGYGRIAFNAEGSGSFSYRTDAGLEQGLRSVKGSADASVSGLSKDAEQWLKAFGGSMLERTADGYKAHIEAGDNRIKINGKIL